MNDDVRGMLDNARRELDRMRAVLDQVDELAASSGDRDRVIVLALAIRMATALQAVRVSHFLFPEEP